MTAAFAQRCPDLSYVDQSFQSTTVEVFFYSAESRQLFSVDPAVTSCTCRKSRALELFGKAEQSGLIVTECQPLRPEQPEPLAATLHNLKNRN
jgi:hypothetical protein